MHYSIFKIAKQIRYFQTINWQNKKKQNKHNRPSNIINWNAVIFFYAQNFFWNQSAGFRFLIEKGVEGL